MSDYRETAVVFGCGDDMLVGVLSVPPAPCETAVLIGVGGPQYRVGSHRQFVSLARFLASEGYSVLRFDYRGMGDSTGEMRSFEHTSDDFGAAIESLLLHVPQARQVVLWGLCDGASAALLHYDRRPDPRIAGLCLVNPWVRSDTSLARTHVKHYYLQRLAQQDFWVKLLRGKVGMAALSGLTRNLVLAQREAPCKGTFQDRMAAAWHAFDGPVLLVLSGNDYTAREFLEHVAESPAWGDALARKHVTRQELPAADHTFSGDGAREQVQAVTLEWLRRTQRTRAPQEHIASTVE